MNVNFGSTYAIKYDYVRTNENNGANGRLYKAKKDIVDEFIIELDRNHKGKVDVSSYDPEKQIYYFNVKNKKDNGLEYLARLFGVKMEKVKSRDMKGSQIVSVGGCGEGRYGELNVISSLISAYEATKNR